MLTTSTLLGRQADGSVRRGQRARAVLAVTAIAGLAILLGSNALAQPAADQVSRIRSLVAAGQFDRASAIVDDWTTRFPDDLDARAWRARLLAWTNRWPEAESAYRELLVLAPNDVDLLSGLADVLYWQRRGEDALAFLDRACALDPRRADIRLRRAQVLEQLGRTAAARVAYADALAHDSGSADASKGLERLRLPGRYDVRIGSDIDHVQETGSGGVIAASLGVRWNERWRTAAAVSQYQRYGEAATRVGVEVARRFRGGDVLTITEAVAPGQSIVPLQELQVEYGRRIGREWQGPLRGAEASIQQRWMVYQDATVLIFTPGFIVYLPKDWTWLVRVSANRVGVSGAGSEWRASGWTRLTIPLHSTVDGFVLAAIGAENYGYRDQLLGFSAETFGGGMRWRMAKGQEITAYGQYQWRSNGQSQTSVGASYGLRF
jgi:YaiO family outer membrane protein